MDRNVALWLWIGKCWLLFPQLKLDNLITIHLMNTSDLIDHWWERLAMINWVLCAPPGEEGWRVDASFSDLVWLCFYLQKFYLFEFCLEKQTKLGVIKWQIKISDCVICVCFLIQLGESLGATLSYSKQYSNTLTVALSKLKLAKTLLFRRPPRTPSNYEP